ncbi:ABC transporter permease subunit [Nocardia sp. SYP-A9097]|uniref:ABC transporter permease n=1 Tax=Nocardia sp. SYP-A9097 TaxID=2663237 RepID=UPI00129A85B2|nr:ABC transporter permease [Nocardia sp. SYP-A9097]MRH89626.1 ABC transporter permease subunit [Nocardia sp. SYP-A9097]
MSGSAESAADTALAGPGVRSAAAGDARGPNLVAAVRQVVRRGLLGVCTVWIVATACFAGIHATPGQVVDVLLGEEPSTPQMRAEVAAQWGLERPLVTQYWDYLGRLVSGDLGQSYQLHTSVVTVLRENAGPTVELAVTSSIFGVLLALGLAAVTAGRRRAGRISAAFELVFASLPHLWIGMMLLLLFSFRLGWVPATGAQTASTLILPTIALGLGAAGVLASVARAEIEHALAQPFTRTVRARGAGRARVVLAHAVPHALLPLIPLVGWTFANVCAGSLIIEQVFSRPGLGQLAVTAVRSGDVPVITGVAIVGVVVFVLVALTCDLLVSVIDPRRAS